MIEMKYKNGKYKMKTYTLSPVPFYVRFWDYIGYKLNIPVRIQWKVRNIFTGKSEWVDKPRAIANDYGLCSMYCTHCKRHTYVDYDELAIEDYRNTPLRCSFCTRILG